jgi:hypothetical protein
VVANDHGDSGDSGAEFDGELEREPDGKSGTEPDGECNRECDAVGDVDFQGE